MTDQTALRDQYVDVLIGGGGLAGLTLARQLRRTLPGVRVTVVEPTATPVPATTHKVGESSVELGSMYLERLGLRDYLRREHIVKLGLRFFPGGGHLPIEQRDELGPPAEPPMPSYQMDRGLLENDLRRMIVDDGARLLDGAKVTDVDLQPGAAPHRIRVKRGDEEATFEARWFVDATGRAALLRRREKLTVPPPYAASAGWFRVSGRVDINHMSSAPEWRARPCAAERWRSTSHFMGPGYWVWIIPLSGGNTSIGIVTHREQHAFDRVRTLERCRAFLAEHEPHLDRFIQQHLDGGEQVLDFRCLKRYSHQIARSYSADRWAIVGEAGAFVDPLYSIGTDYIGMANTLAVELIAADRARGDLGARVEEVDAQLQGELAWGFELFRQSGPVFGHPAAMATKNYWDDFVYWSSQCQAFAQRLFSLTGEPLARYGRQRARFTTLHRMAQGLLRQWALLGPREHTGRFVPIPGVGSLTLASHTDLEAQLGPTEALDLIDERLAQAEEMLVELALRIAAELGPDRTLQLIDAVDLGTWHLPVPAARLSAEALDGDARRAALPPVALDLEDHLPPVIRHPEALAAMEQVEQALSAPATVSLAG